MNIREETQCRICQGTLKEVLDLGRIYPSAFIPPTEDVSEDMKAPLCLAECQTCGLVQLKHTVDLDLMYRQYWYSSSLNKSMVSSLDDVVREAEKRVRLKREDTVVDIGCNDGTLLSLYSAKNLVKVGYDPALNIEPGKDVYFVNDYFTADGYFDTYGFVKAKIVTAIAMFYDLPDPHKFVEDVKTILHDDGIFVIQFTDLLSMFQVCAFDNICHEHLEYYKLKDVSKLLESHDLEVIDVSYNSVNGGSVRVTAAHRYRYPVKESVISSLSYEQRYIEVYGFDTFKLCIEKVKIDIYNFLALAKNLKMRVYLLGASTKGNTLLQVCNIDNTRVPYAAEVNKEKFGLRTIGSNIEIISEELALEMKPDFFLVPVWHFKKSILDNPKIEKYIEDGGKVVFPLPNFHIVEKGNYRKHD